MPAALPPFSWRWKSPKASVASGDSPMNQPLPLMLRLLAACAAATLLAACSMGGLFGGGNAAQNQQLQNATATPAAVAQAQTSALPAIATECPPIRVRAGSEAMFYYGNGRTGDPRALQYQGE